jgi:hypothetical protein
MSKKQNTKESSNEESMIIDPDDLPYEFDAEDEGKRIFQEQVMEDYWIE